MSWKGGQRKLRSAAGGRAARVFIPGARTWTRFTWCRFRRNVAPLAAFIMNDFSLIPSSLPAFRLQHRQAGRNFHKMVAYYTQIPNPGNHLFSTLRFQSFLSPQGKTSQARTQSFQAGNWTFFNLLFKKCIYFWLCRTAFGILVSWSRMEPSPLALKVRSF